MPRMDRVAFNVLKKRIALQAHKDRRKGEAKSVEFLEVGNTTTFSVVDNFQAQVPGSVFGWSDQQETVTIKAGSAVDNEFHSEDSIKFSRGSQNFEASETPSGDGNRTYWSIEKRGRSRA